MWTLGRQIQFFLLVICLVGTAKGSPQTMTLRVRILDPSLAQIRESTVRIKDSNGGVIKEIKSDGSALIVLTGIQRGLYVLEVEAKDFKPYAGEINIKDGQNEVVVKLEIAAIKEGVNVKPSELDKVTDPREGAFTNFLSREQIAALPDDPEEMEKVLRQIAGQDAVIRVDGFTAGRLPPKSQIASIKIIRSNFDAEFHEAGSPLVDITTKAGGSSWHGAVSFHFNDETLNARQPFATLRRPSQLRT